MKIAIRADGGSVIGMGHIMRTLVLARELAKANTVFYVCRKDKPLTEKYINGINKVRKEGFEVILINEDNVIDELANINADCLITDSYDVDEDYFDETKDMFSKTGYIDDINAFFYNVDFVVNQNVTALNYKYKCNKDTALLLGTDYVMLRDEFRECEPNKIKTDVKDILITMGGADPANFTFKLLKYIKDLDYNFHVVIGPSFSKVDEIKEEIKNKDNIKLYFNVNMVEMMKICDIAITAAGSTLYELGALGVPTLGVILADNQVDVAKEMHKNGYMINLGWFDKVKRSEVLEAIDRISGFDLRNNMSNSAIKQINKDGVQKLCIEIQKLF
ncbi:UDP-2,4-diacetamido-2,4,6-trideoxy-beta-L-altropyranose hydrolase [Clostridium algoriphilum]|uniref:UDP-2,4-diacetamido-2,4, 6-trideoxy-beta-L-altropyranose hydrolase n=1 Tax=Clostridium algoriphilum TaxID=198347 RepID=UPI001CF5361B|nr:UDP-2,4-diacetamido-2,4,6-trideoxy-beta-L-altropyranose hydrolase [Clostridium algoriphilum]MCB2293973.1 UDP-2,4-diacetamido-2,4,6-trideoxy-beta-L-altropyranose hydrolase [Clostridium algoriphilum]